MCFSWEGIEVRRRKGKESREVENDRIKTIGYSSNIEPFINYVSTVFNVHLHVEFCTNVRLSFYSS